MKQMKIKRFLVFAAMALMAVGARAQDEKLICEVNWEGLAYPVISEFPEYDPWKSTDEGLAIINPALQVHVGDVWLSINYGPFKLEANHDYVVRLTMKIPSDGMYNLIMGGIESSTSYLFSVNAGDDFQVVEVRYPNFCGEEEGDTIFYSKELDRCGLRLACGWVEGTTVLKNVQVFEVVKGSEATIHSAKATKPDGALYNLAGQKVSSSYKGIVIKNGKKYNNK